MMSFQEIGDRIKARRLEMGISGRELARRTGLSASFISQIERGKTKISIESLRLIAENMEVSFLYLLADESNPADSQLSAEAPPSPALDSGVVRAANRPQLTFPDLGVTYELLSRDFSRQMEALHGRLAPGTENIARRLRVPTEEFIYVVSGALIVGLQTGNHQLHAGDAIYFDGQDLLRLSCGSQTEEAVWISVITPPAL